MFNKKAPTRTEALGLFNKAAAMMEEVVAHHSVRVAELETELKENKSELEMGKKSLDALNKIINPK